MPETFTHPVTGKVTEIPTEVFADAAKTRKLTFATKKTKGCGVGGWYSDEAGNRFMVKFGGENCYMEKLINDLAKICVAESLVAEETAVGNATILEVRDAVVIEKVRPCFISREIPEYRDLISIKVTDDSGVEDVKETTKAKKSHAPKFHPAYSFNALIGFDDTSEENIGIAGAAAEAKIVDYGNLPNFLHPHQIDLDGIPFQLASATGHRNLSGMQFIRRRYFGFDSFLSPSDFSKPQKMRPEDINYHAVLTGVKKICDNEAAILATVAESAKSAAETTTLSEEEKKKYAEQMARFGAALTARIGWLRENFAEDIALIDDAEKKEYFSSLKWRLHPNFKELMVIEDEIFTRCAKKDVEENFKQIAEMLDGRTREEILELDLRTVEKADLQEYAKKNFMLHNALAAKDYELAKWLVVNEISDINQHRNSRVHNYQLLRLTPLHAAIAMYHDALFYQTEEVEPLRELIKVLKAKFIEKNGEAYDASKKEEHAKQGYDSFALELTFMANQKYETIMSSAETLAATKIQRSFRAFSARRLAAEEAAKEGGRDE